MYFSFLVFAAQETFLPNAVFCEKCIFVQSQDRINSLIPAPEAEGILVEGTITDALRLDDFPQLKKLQIGRCANVHKLVVGSNPMLQEIVVQGCIEEIEFMGHTTHFQKAILDIQNLQLLRLIQDSRIINSEYQIAVLNHRLKELCVSGSSLQNKELNLTNCFSLEKFTLLSNGRISSLKLGERMQHIIIEGEIHCLNIRQCFMLKTFILKRKVRSLSRNSSYQDIIQWEVPENTLIIYDDEGSPPNKFGHKYNNKGHDQRAKSPPNKPEHKDDDDEASPPNKPEHKDDDDDEISAMFESTPLSTLEMKKKPNASRSNDSNRSKSSDAQDDDHILPQEAPCLMTFQNPLPEPSPFPNHLILSNSLDKQDDYSPAQGALHSPTFQNSIPNCTPQPNHLNPAIAFAAQDSGPTSSKDIPQKVEDTSDQSHDHPASLLRESTSELHTSSLETDTTYNTSHALRMSITESGFNGTNAQPSKTIMSQCCGGCCIQ